MAAARDDTVVGNRQVAEGPHDALPGDCTMASRRTNRMKVALINLETEGAHCLGASSLCRFTTPSAVNS